MQKKISVIIISIALLHVSSIISTYIDINMVLVIICNTAYQPIVVQYNILWLDIFIHTGCLLESIFGYSAP